MELSSTEPKPSVAGGSGAFRAKPHFQAAPPAHGALQAASHRLTQANGERRTSAELGLPWASCRTIWGASVQPLWQRSWSRAAQHHGAGARRGSTCWAPCAASASQAPAPPHCSGGTGVPQGHQCRLGMRQKPQQFHWLMHTEGHSMPVTQEQAPETPKSWGWTQP